MEQGTSAFKPRAKHPIGLRNPELNPGATGGKKKKKKDALNLHRDWSRPHRDLVWKVEKQYPLGLRNPHRMMQGTHISREAQTVASVPPEHSEHRLDSENSFACFHSSLPKRETK